MLTRGDKFNLQNKIIDLYPNLMGFFWVNSWIEFQLLNIK